MLMLLLQNRKWPGRGYSARLEVRVVLGMDLQNVLLPVLRKHALKIHLLGVGSAKQGSCLELNYRVTLVERSVLYPMASELQALEGVVGVNLQGADGDKRCVRRRSWPDGLPLARAHPRPDPEGCRREQHRPGLRMPTSGVPGPNCPGQRPQSGRPTGCPPPPIRADRCRPSARPRSAKWSG